MRGETDYLGEVHQNGNGTLNSVSFSNHYNQMPLDTEQSSKTFVFESPRREPVFDDLVYEAGFEASSSSYKPPDTHRRNSKRISTLERGMQVQGEGGRATVYLDVCLALLSTHINIIL